ncbi:MAG: FtsQ-type POTRA domain-containing protein [Eggerthellaceae bacterium]|nr:FtsQ-type POTRA domain-containing protein [Eggerthellaceae bacterium]
MARKQVTKRKVDRKAAEQAAQPKAAYQSIATRKKWDLQTAAAQAEKQAREARNSSRSGTRVERIKIRDLRAETGGETAEAIKSRRRLRIGIISALLFIIAAILALGMVYRSDLFSIEFLSVKGVRHLTASEMIALAAVPEDTTLLRVDTEDIRQRLLTDAWVKDAQIQRILPNTLEITITEREIAAVVEISNPDASATRRWAISADGMWLMPIPDRDSEAGKLVSEIIYEDIEKVLTITDVPYSEQPDIGTYCNDAYVNCALSIVNTLSTSLVNMIEAVIASNTASTTLILSNGVEVVFGDDTDVRLKEQICLQLLEKYEGKIVYINVSVPDNTTYRAL